MEILLKEQGGHDEEWIETEKIKELEHCSICNLVPRNAVTHRCGNLWCQSCWSQWFTTRKTCPICRESDDAVPAFREQRNILNLLIECPRKCGESVRLGDKKVHFQEKCKFRRVRCSLCEEETSSVELPNHLTTECIHRSINCPECNTETKFSDLAEHQTKDCPSRLVQCDLCQGQVRYLLMEEHLANVAFLGKHFIALQNQNLQLKKDIEKLQSENSLLKNINWINKLKYHPGRIGAAPNGIGRVDKKEIMWASKVNTHKAEGYSFFDYHQGWNVPLQQVFKSNGDNICVWSCCGGSYDSPPCSFVSSNE